MSDDLFDLSCFDDEEPEHEDPLSAFTMPEPSFSPALSSAGAPSSSSLSSPKTEISRYIVPRVNETKKMRRERKKLEKRKRGARDSIQSYQLSKKVVGGFVTDKVQTFSQLSDGKQTLYLELKSYFKGTNHIRDGLLPLIPKPVLPKKLRPPSLSSTTAVKKRRTGKAQAKSRKEEKQVTQQGEQEEQEEREEEEEEEETAPQTGALSMRTFGCLFTKYQQEVGSIHLLRGNVVFDLQTAYKAEMALNRKCFDMFRRGSTVLWPVDDTNTMFFETSLGQLNFWRFVCKWDLLSYVKDNLPKIKALIRKWDKEKRAKQIHGKGMVKKKTRKRQRMCKSHGPVLHTHEYVSTFKTLLGKEEEEEEEEQHL